MRKIFPAFFLPFFLLSFLGSSRFSFATEPTFSDVDAEDRAYAAIEYLAQKGILKGYEGGIFESYKGVNRAEAAKVMVLVNGGNPDPQRYKNCFPDVHEEWFASYVCYAKEKGWVKGHPQGNFAPADGVNHAELTKMALEPFFGTQIAQQTPEQIAQEMKQMEIKQLEMGYEIEELKMDPAAWHAPYLAFGERKNLLRRSSYSDWPSDSAKRDQVAEQFFRALMMKQEGWEAYSDYLRDRSFQEQGLTHLMNPDYPCYSTSHFGFFPAFAEYMQTKYGITQLNGLVYDSRNLPHFATGQFCVLEDGGVLFSGVRHEKIEEGRGMWQHLIRFNAAGQLVKDDSASCTELDVFDRPSLLIAGVDLETVELLHCFYVKDKDHVYYRIDNMIGPSIGPKLMEGAAPNSFELLTFPYSKDANNVYFLGQRLENVDWESFEVFPTPGSPWPFSYYAKDANHVYYYGKEIPEADPATFERLSFEGMELAYPTQHRSFNYSKDAHHIYFGGSILEGADPASFRILNENYSVDAHSVYSSGKKMEGWEGPSFEILDETFVRDAKGVYYREDGFQTLEGADSETFEKVGQMSDSTFFYRDQNQVYYLQFGRYNQIVQLTPFPGIDPISFEILNKDYLRDKDNLYELGYGEGGNQEPVLVQDRDPETFEILNDYYTKDRYGVYFESKLVLGLDLSTFQVIGDGFGKDQFHVYRGTQALSQADGMTFEKVLGFEDPDCYTFYKDKNHLYDWMGRLVPTSNLDLSTAHLTAETVVEDAQGVECHVNMDDLAATVCLQK